MAATISASYSLSALAVSDSQPGMEACSSAVSFRAAQALSWLTGRVCWPVSCMVGSSLGLVQPGGRVGGVRELLEALQIVRGQELVDVRQHRANARCLGLEGAVTQQRVEPQQAAAALV